VSVPGPWAVAVHVIDALGSNDAPATVVSLNDATVDPSGANKGVIGASIVRGGKTSYAVASSGTDGTTPNGTLTYGTPGAASARHVVYDAPEASDGTSSVTAVAQSGRCAMTVTAGSGKGLTGHPLIFDVGAASGGCVVTDAPSGNPGKPPSGSSSSSGGGSSSGGPSSSSGGGSGGSNDGPSDFGMGSHGGCGCVFAGGGTEDATLLLFSMLALGAGLASRRRGSSR
jgi:hypothetical protein